jgi:hypothetical protein
MPDDTTDNLRKKKSTHVTPALPNLNPGKPGKAVTVSLPVQASLPALQPAPQAATTHAQDQSILHNWQMPLRQLLGDNTTDHAVLEQLKSQLSRVAHALQPPADQDAVKSTPQTIPQTGNPITGQHALEDVLALSLVLMDRLNVNADWALRRVTTRWQRKDTARRFIVYPDFVEIWVGHEYRGGWPIQPEDTHQSIEQMALDLGCTLEYSQTRQLSLLDSRRD